MCVCAIFAVCFWMCLCVCVCVCLFVKQGPYINRGLSPSPLNFIILNSYDKSVHYIAILNHIAHYGGGIGEQSAKIYYSRSIPLYLGAHGDEIKQPEQHIMSPLSFHTEKNSFWLIEYILFQISCFVSPSTNAGSSPVHSCTYAAIGHKLCIHLSNSLCIFI